MRFGGDSADVFSGLIGSKALPPKAPHNARENVRVTASWAFEVEGLQCGDGDLSDGEGVQLLVSGSRWE